MYNQMEGRTQELRQGLYGCVSATSTGATKATGNQFAVFYGDGHTPASTYNYPSSGRNGMGRDGWDETRSILR